MRRSVYPSRPRARTCSHFSLLKTLPSRRGIVSRRRRQRPGALSSVGRFSGVHQWPVMGVARGTRWRHSRSRPFTSRRRQRHHHGRSRPAHAKPPIFASISWSDSPGRSRLSALRCWRAAHRTHVCRPFVWALGASLPDHLADLVTILASCGRALGFSPSARRFRRHGSVDDSNIAATTSAGARRRVSPPPRNRPTRPSRTAPPPSGGWRPPRGRFRRRMLRMEAVHGRDGTWWSQKDGGSGSGRASSACRAIRCGATWPVRSPECASPQACTTGLESVRSRIDEMLADSAKWTQGKQRLRRRSCTGRRGTRGRRDVGQEVLGRVEAPAERRLRAARLPTWCSRRRRLL